MKRALWLVAFDALLFILAAADARAWAPEQPLADAIFGTLSQTPGAGQVPGLVMTDPQSVRVAIEPYEGELRVLAQLRGVFTRAPYWIVVWKDKTAGKIGRHSQNTSFSFEVPITQEVTKIDLHVVGPDGDLESTSYTLTVPSIKAMLATTATEAAKRNIVFASLGPSMISYSQTSRPSLSEIALTAKVSYQYVLAPPRVDLNVAAYMTLLPLTTSPPEMSARFLGLNLRVGYLLPFALNPWQLSIATGWYYVTMMTSTTLPDNQFGISNVSGPQLFPVVKRILDHGGTISGYAKYSPIAKSLSLLTLSSREIAFGVSWTRSLTNSHPLTIAVDYANVALQEGITEASATTFGVSAGYGW